MRVGAVGTRTSPVKNFSQEKKSTFAFPPNQKICGSRTTLICKENSLCGQLQEANSSGWSAGPSVLSRKERRVSLGWSHLRHSVN